MLPAEELSLPLTSITLSLPARVCTVDESVTLPPSASVEPFARMVPKLPANLPEISTEPGAAPASFADTSIVPVFCAIPSSPAASRTEPPLVTSEPASSAPLLFTADAKASPPALLTITMLPPSAFTLPLFDTDAWNGLPSGPITFRSTLPLTL